MISLRELEDCADLSVRRGCGFGGLAIACVMAGLSYQPQMAAETGAILTSLMGIILILKARAAPFRSHKTTEVWVMLDEGRRPPPAQAQRLVMGTLKDTYLRYARLAGVTAAGLWTVSLAIMIA
ncbi:hypothetical protein [Azospirillum sp. ST 5-10]|uniref:hypothetical protein n=1 Tax=unclassified Azospirillum TaxID=2630922 RepID=UPI003F4A620B